jgi:hypothetical protein
MAHESFDGLQLRHKRNTFLAGYSKWPDVSPAHPGTPRRAVPRARPQRVKIRGVPSGAHGATNKEHRARCRVSEAAGSPLRV